MKYNHMLDIAFTVETTERGWSSIETLLEMTEEEGG